MVALIKNITEIIYYKIKGSYFTTKPIRSPLYMHTQKHKISESSKFHHTSHQYNLQEKAQRSAYADQVMCMLESIEIVSNMMHMVSLVEIIVMVVL